MPTHADIALTRMRSKLQCKGSTLYNRNKRVTQARSTLRLSKAQKFVCFIEMKLCVAHDMCLAQPRTAEKKFTLCLILLSLQRLRPEVFHFPGTGTGL